VSPVGAVTGQVSGALTRFRPVPGDIAVYDIALEPAARALRVEPSVVLELAEQGLPHRIDAACGPMFDYDDVMNVGRFSGTGATGPELALRFLMRFVAMPAASWYAPRGWLVTVGAAADPADPGRPAAGNRPGVEFRRLRPTGTACWCSRRSNSRRRTSSSRGGRACGRRRR